MPTLMGKALHSAASTASEVSLERPHSISSAFCKGLSSRQQPSQGQTSLVYINFWEACDNHDKVLDNRVYVVSSGSE
jgi:hypothetical protein